MSTNTAQITDQHARVVTEVATQLAGSCPTNYREDVAADIRLHVLESLHKFDPNRGVQFKTWVHRVGQNSLRSILRGHSGRKGGMSYRSVSSTTDGPVAFGEALEFREEVETGEVEVEYIRPEQSVYRPVAIVDQVVAREAEEAMPENVKRIFRFLRTGFTKSEIIRRTDWNPYQYRTALESLREYPEVAERMAALLRGAE